LTAAVTGGLVRLTGTSWMAASTTPATTAILVLFMAQKETTGRAFRHVRSGGPPFRRLPAWQSGRASVIPPGPGAPVPPARTPP